MFKIYLRILFKQFFLFDLNYLIKNIFSKFFALCHMFVFQMKENTKIINNFIIIYVTINIIGVICNMIIKYLNYFF